MSEDKIPYVTKLPPKSKFDWKHSWRETSEEIRLKDPTTGAEKGGKEARFDLIPAGALFTLARVFGRGAKKYAERNWERGYPWSWSFAALMRHAWAFWRGEELDKESGLPHLAHAAWHCFVLQEFTNDYPDKDDRSKMHLDPACREEDDEQRKVESSQAPYDYDAEDLLRQSLANRRQAMQEVAKESGVSGRGSLLCSGADESELQRRFNNLQNVVAEVTKVNTQTKAELAQAREELASAHCMQARLTSQTEELLQQNADLRKAVDHWKACWTFARSALSTAEAEVAILRDRLSPKPQAFSDTP